MPKLTRSMLRTADPLADWILSPAAYLSALLLGAVRERITRFPISRAALLRAGVFPIRDHYYEPLFNPAHLRRSLEEDRDLPGIDWNVEAQLGVLRALRFGSELTTLPEEGELGDHEFFLGNGMFEWCDAEYWYSLVRHLKPRHIIEIGAGYSTLVAQKAIQANARDDARYVCEHTCVEPYEAPWLEKTRATIIRQRVEDVPRETFARLEENDVLFIDSSHVIRPQGDVVTELLSIVPRVRRGVIVHVHDIFSPRDYPKEWVVDLVRMWTEQYLLEAFLTHNDSWEIVGALNYLSRHHPNELKAACPHVRSPKTPTWEPSSFYIRRK